ncbi:peptidoglycan-binding protein [Shewanella benthica]|uniref:peptidoglycan-binding domain-containing protein n=1 Tax=Shewanella benthica TaxID=43661 RepID=UPI001879A207|nr:peptidoglycan-binding domain-containing protein [Shewanella benthica]MBE7214709.1 hypothetical protein [Shewanella benthica]MCL1063153.1 peptidoglycan-binding protein [Shewanella benthica]
MNLGNIKLVFLVVFFSVSISFITNAKESNKSQILEIKVRGKESNIGVQSIVEIKFGQKTELNLGSTDKSGNLELENPSKCKNRTIVVYPRSHKYAEYEEDATCQEIEIVKLKKIDNTWVSMYPISSYMKTATLNQNISTFTDTPSTSALLLMGVSEQLRDYNALLSGKAYRISILDTAHTLGYKGTIFQDRKNTILTQKFLGFIKSYQNNENLLLSGELDIATLEHIAGHGLRPFEKAIISKEDLNKIKNNSFKIVNTIPLDKLNLANHLATNIIAEITAKEELGVPEIKLIKGYYSLSVSNEANDPFSQSVIDLRFYNSLKVIMLEQGSGANKSLEEFIAFDPTQSKIVLTKDGKKVVESFQEIKNIHVDGIIGPETLKAATNQ